MPTVLEWGPTVDPSAFVLQVREALAAGSLILLPGDAGPFALFDPAVADASRLPGTPCVLSYGPDDAARFAPNLPVAARRLMYRAWPAPLVVALPAHEVTLPDDWPDEVKQRVAADGLVRFRCPDHIVTEAIYPAVHAEGRLRPLAIVDLPLPAVEAAIEQLGDAVGLAVTAGQLKVHSLTEVKTDANGWQILTEGDFSRAEVERLAARIVLFVCTGNTCRSPLAEGLARKMLAERLGCSQDELAARGFWILSAGVAAFGGSPASTESLDIAEEFGADLQSHRSRPVNPQLLAAADDVIAMTQSHAYSLTATFPGLGPEPRLLCGDADLDDPIGASLDVYRACAQTIQKHLERYITEWVGQ
jgi:protein-tyrosine phosphatase